MVNMRNNREISDMFLIVSHMLNILFISPEVFNLFFNILY